MLINPSACTHAHTHAHAHTLAVKHCIQHLQAEFAHLSPSPRIEAASDQSDIEGRVLALRAELRRRKAEAQRLKKEQRLRHKERLKAQEASLLKQLEV